MSGQISENSVLTELSALLSRPVDARARVRAQRHLLDWLGCAVAGAVEPAGKILREARGVGPAAQAFCWGGLGNILEMDDVDKRALLHPGPSIIPAALAMAAVTPTDSETFLNAIVTGYDATIRLGRAVGPAHYAIWHNTGTCGAIGAAAACAVLLKLDASARTHAMALAMSQSTGLWQTRHDPASMGKQLHTAHAARAGFEAARLAAAGFTGPLDILEGEQGFFKATCPDGDPQQIVRDRGADWLIHDVSFKPWPACRHAHAVIDAALELRDRVDLRAASPIYVATYSDALKFCDRAKPKTVIEAKFSLQHAVAMTLLEGAPSLEHFALDVLGKPEVAALRARVQTTASEEFDAVYPARFGARVSAGDVSITVSDALGDPENPVSDAQIGDKARMLLAAGGQSTAAAERAIDLTFAPDLNVGALLQFVDEGLS